MKDIPNIGEVPGENAKRDAVHIAVAPLIAGEHLQRGARVGIHKGKAYMPGHEVYVKYELKTIGIVDPYMKELFVKRDEKFWLFLYPNTITSLRHVWTHPAFQSTLPKGNSNE